VLHIGVDGGVTGRYDYTNTHSLQFHCLYKPFNFRVFP
jgi:hypothetical protein